MATTIYQSVAIIDTLAKRDTAYELLASLFRHIQAGTGGYTMDLVQADFALTTAQLITVALSNPLPAGQVTRYSVGQVALTLPTLTLAALKLLGSVYQSPVINTAPKRIAAYDAFATFLQHLIRPTAYSMNLISVDFGVVTAQTLTIAMTGDLPDAAQVNRYNLTKV